MNNIKKTTMAFSVLFMLGTAQEGNAVAIQPIESSTPQAQLILVHGGGHHGARVHHGGHGHPAHWHGHHWHGHGGHWHGHRGVWWGGVYYGNCVWTPGGYQCPGYRHIIPFY